jgi:hypothetical protein
MTEVFQRTAEDLNAMVERLDVPLNELADLHGIDRRRLRRWLAGQEDVPPLFENAVELMGVLVTLRRFLRHGSHEPARALVADALERLVGGAHAHAMSEEFGRPIFVCPDCTAVSFNTNDALQGWCARCGRATRPPLDGPDPSESQAH